jgi:type II secretory pathway pseudopilin PulG/TM2 domain-containing membrane protein YozV
MSEINGQSKFCSTCGKQMHLKAEICPSCGVRATGTSSGAISKVALLLITILIGGIGGHKFYVKKYGLGILYLLFFWTGIPGFIALIEFIIYCTKSEAELQQLYPETSAIALILAIILPLVGIAVIGILAAIAIPQFAMYRAKASDSIARSDLNGCVSEVESYYADHQTYPTRTGQMTCGATNDVAVLYLALGPENFQIITFHRNGHTAYLAESGSTEIGENSRMEIEGQLGDQPAWDGGYGSFYFIE